MLILRRITSESIEINTEMDRDYVLILKERNIEEFKKTAKQLNWENEESIKDIYGFIVFDEGESIMPLYEKSNYYVMASDGRTFANITHK